MTSGAQPTIGIDFGTTNTVVSMTNGDGPARLVRFPTSEGDLFAFRSALSFHNLQGRGGEANERVVEAGPWAIEAYLEDPLETRFIQSFKSFAASAAFTETRILNKRYLFEDLLAAFLLKVREHAGDAMSDLPPRVIVGRPVTFAGGNPDEASGAAALRGRLPAPGLHRHPLFLRAGRRGLLLRPPAETGRHRAGRRLRRRHQRLLAGPFRAQARRLAGLDAAQPFGRRRGRRRLRLPDHRPSGVAGPGQGLAVQGLRQPPADPAALLHRLRPLGSAGPAARLARHARHPLAGKDRAGTREDQPPDRGAGRQPRLRPLPAVSGLKEASVGQRARRRSASRPARS
jgi:hypothetical protein